MYIDRITSMMRDGTAMVGRIVFASAYGTSLDFNSKRWRLLADVLNDIAICIEIAAPLYPMYFVLLACMGSFLKAMYVGLSMPCTVSSARVGAT